MPCPVCGRAACMRWSKATGVPSRASSVIAPDDVGEAREPRGAPERERAHGGERLRSVEQREAFLGFQADGLDAGALQRDAARHALPAIDRFAFADDAERQVGERRQIAGGAHRALRGDHGMNAAIQHERQRLGKHRAHAAIAERQRVGAQGHDDARLRLGERRAEPAGVAAHQIELQAREFVTGDAHFAQFAEAGIDAVDRQVIFRGAAHHRARGVHLGDRGGSDLDRSEASAMAAISRNERGCPLSSIILSA